MTKGVLLCGGALLACLAAPVYAQSTMTAVAPDPAQSTGSQGGSQVDTPAQAQVSAGVTPPGQTGPAGDIVVTGIRASQRASLELKRSALGIVDAITATDVGKFPDANIADALQRITGVSIDRSNGEGRYITVRGFGPQYNNVLVNGRTMATDNNGREFSFDTLSSALISRAEIFKTYQPQLQEGGIGATVNVMTARPLDGKAGVHLSAHAGGTYDFLAKKASPDSGMVANYRNEDSTFGVEASLTYTDRKSFDDFAGIDGWAAVNPNSNTVAIINGTPQSTGLTPANITYLNAGGTKTLYIPQNLYFKRATIDSQRLTANLTAQYRPTDTLLVTLDGLYSKYKVDNTTNFFSPFFTPPYYSDIAFDANGTATHFTRPGSGFAAANPLLAADPRFSGQQNDNIVNLQNRNSQTYQLGGNVKWDATSNLRFEADASNSRATQNFYAPFVVVGSVPVGSPTFDVVSGQTIPNYVSASSITDPTTLRTHYSTIPDSKYKDVITELRLQGEWKAEAGLLNSIQFGGFYSHREKTDVEYQTPGANYCTYCGYVVPIDQNLVSPYYMNNYLPNSSGSRNIPNQYFTFNPTAVIAYESQLSTLNQRSPGQQTNVPTSTFVATGGYNPVLFPGSGFDVTEKVWAGYVNTTWKGPSWTFNAGLRISDTSTSSSGVIQPLQRIQQNVGDSNLNFVYGASSPTLVTNHYVDFLPAANLKVDATQTVVLRAAVSKTLTRPTLSNLGTNNSYGGRVTQALSSGGNPLLQPFISWNYDLSAEWYLDRSTSLSADGFHKTFSGFISNQTVIVPRNGFDSQGNPVVYNFYDTRPRNGNSGTVNGVELAAQHSFNGNGLISGFGVGANYTYVSSNQKTVSPTDCSQIEGLSKNSYNVDVFYEKYGVHARGAYNWRSSYLAVCQGYQGQSQTTAAYGQFDFNLAYDLNQHFQVYLEGVNMANAYNYQYSVYYDRMIRDESTGRRILFGVRAKF